VWVWNRSEARPQKQNGERRATAETPCRESFRFCAPARHDPSPFGTNLRLIFEF